MNGLRDWIALVNGKVNDFVWGLPMLVLLQAPEQAYTKKLLAAVPKLRRA